MKIFLFTLCGAVMLAYFAEHYTNGSVDDNGRINLNMKAVIAVIVFLVIISGFRYLNYYQSDEYNYRVMAMAMEGEPISSIQIGVQTEWIFSLLGWISANVFHDSQFLVFISAAVTNISIILFFKKYARPFWFAIFLYICGGAYFASMNVLRQYLAIALVIWCYPLAEKEKTIRYIVLVFLAAGIHQSAWIMLPAYFLLRKKDMGFSVIVILITTVVVVANFETVMTLILSSLPTYEHYLDNLLSGGYGVKLIRILAWLIPYTLVVVFHKKIHEYGLIEYNLIYATIVAACIMAISYEYVFVARLDVYFSIASLCSIIKVPDIFERNSGRFVKTAMIGLFFAFGCYQMMNFSEYHNVLFEEIAGVVLYN